MEARANPKIETSSHSFAWKWMRYSAFLLIPLVYIHVILQDLIVGGHNLSLTYVQGRWALWGWRAYDIFLLAFAFSHGANGLRQVLSDYMKSERAIRWMSWAVAALWLIVTLIGAAAIVGRGEVAVEGEGSTNHRATESTEREHFWRRRVRSRRIYLCEGRF